MWEIGLLGKSKIWSRSYLMHQVFAYFESNVNIELNLCIPKFDITNVSFMSLQNPQHVCQTTSHSTR